MGSFFVVEGAPLFVPRCTVFNLGFPEAKGSRVERRNGSKLNHQKSAGFGPCFPLTRVPFWVHIFDPQPNVTRRL